MQKTGFWLLFPSLLLQQQVFINRVIDIGRFNEGVGCEGRYAIDFGTYGIVFFDFFQQ